MKQKLFTLLFALVFSIGTMFASDIQVDGIWYDFDVNTQTASVTFRGPYSTSYSDEYSGSIIIPSSVIYNGVTYSVTSIGNHSFKECPSLSSITIPNSVTEIGNDAFKKCFNLTNVSIPNSVIEIGVGAFDHCSSLTSISIPNGVTYIGEGTFLSCSSLTSIVIPNGVTHIGKAAFGNCSNLESINIPNSVSEIGGEAFSGCRSLNSIDIPNSVTEIGDYAFYGCRKLVSITIPNSIVKIKKEAFAGCSGLVSITIPNSVISIGEKAFYECKGLTDVTIPNSVSMIGTRAFGKCTGLSYIIIPNSVNSIGDYAFYGCNNIRSVFIKRATPPSIGESIFMDSTTIYVPNGSVDNFQFGSNWNTYIIKEIIETQSDRDYPTSLSTDMLHHLWEINNSYIVSYSIEGGEQFAGNTLEYTGLEPNSEYADIPILLTSNTGEMETISVSFTTSALELTTQQPKAVSSNTAILLAQTNMADNEISCGFEYKRNDAPADMEGTKVLCPVANSQMAGRLKGLKDNVYYKYRAFYQSSAGNMYYGDWQYIFTGDVAVEFDPILYTYAATAVSENAATIKGYALAGSDDFTEQGFEYWADSRNSSANAPYRMRSALGEHHTVTASGISMRVTLTDLAAGTVYKYRTYAKVGGQTLYGSEMSFTTQGTYTPPTYIITFVNWDGTELQSEPVEEGVMPVYNGETPVRQEDELYTYTFSGWTPEVIVATADATYTAVYNATSKTEGFEDVMSDNTASKILRDGEILIIRGDKTYTVTGQDVK